MPLPDPLRTAATTADRALRLLPAIAASLGAGVPGVLREQARRHRDAPFLRTLDASFTYGAAEAEVNRAARFWRGRGVGPGQVVALLMENCAEAVLHQLALGRLGAASAMVNTELRGRALAHVLEACAPRAIVVDGAHAAALDSLERKPGRVWVARGHAAIRDARGLLDLAGPVARASARPVEPAPIDRDTVYTYLFTSGTTGLPKAAPIRHQRFLMAGAALHVFALWLRPRDVVFTPMPLYHASAQLVALSTALAAGACLAVAPHFSAHRYWDQAEALGATVGVYVGELCRYLLNTAPTPAEGRHRIHTFVGNGLRADVWEAFQARFGDPRIVEFYGATEGNALLVNRSGKVGSCGRPVPILAGPLDGLALVRYDVAADTHPRDARGRVTRCAPGEVGELVGRILLPTERFDGYLDPAATDRKVLAGAFHAWDRYFRTGDLLRQDAEGDYFFVDRIGDTYRWKGENVSTQEVAELLAGAGGAAALMVYGVPVPGQEGRAGMAAVAAGPQGFDPAAFWARATEALPPYARPAFVRLCPALDTTGTMKFRKVDLQAQGFGDGVADPLFVRVDRERRYAPLDAARRADLASGRLRL